MNTYIRNPVLPIQNLKFSSNCIVCYLRPTSKISFIIHPLQGRCRHTEKNFYGKPFFEKWKFSSTLLIISNLLTFISTLSMLHISWDECKQLSRKCVVSINWVTIVVVADVLIKCCSFNFNSRLDELNGLANIFENRKFYGINNLICLSCGEKIARNQKIFIWGSILLVMMTGITTHIVENNYWKWYQITLIHIGICSQLFVLFCIKYKFSIMAKVYQSMWNHLRKIMNKVKINKDPSFRMELQRILHLYLEMVRSHQRLNDFLNPSFLVWLFASSSVTVVNFYIALIMFESKITSEFLFVALGSSTCCFLMDYLMTLNERFTEQAASSLKYLFRYRISGLEYEEATQVEMLIMSLISLKPRTEASDMFKIGTRLLPSIFGFIVTYVLVAMQFKPQLVEDY